MAVSPGNWRQLHQPWRRIMEDMEIKEYMELMEMELGVIME